MCKFYFGAKLLQRISRFYFYLILWNMSISFLHCMAIKILLDSPRSQQSLTFNKRPAIHLLKDWLCWSFWGRGFSVGLVTTSRGRKWHARASTQAKSQIIGSLSSMSFFPSSSYLISCSRKSSVLLSFPMAATFHFDYTNGNIGNERVILSRIETFLFCCKWQQVPFLDIEVFVRVKLPITEILDFVDWHNIYMKY